jgi:hypothetical protein
LTVSPVRIIAVAGNGCVTSILALVFLALDY